MELLPNTPGHLVDVRDVTLVAGGAVAVVPADPAAGTVASFSVSMNVDRSYEVIFRAPIAPTAAFTFALSPFPVPVSVLLDAGSSTDDRGIVRYEWDFDNDGIVERSSTSSSASADFTVAGTYQVRLRVVDGDGLFGEVIHNVIVDAPPPPPPGANSAPVAAYTFGPSNPLEGQLVTFNASPSSDDIGIASYAWDFEDNGSVDAATVVASHTYATAGTYSARLTVTDAAGLADDEIHTIVVSPALPAVPVISTQPQNVTVAVGETATFSVLASGVAPLSYRWQRDGVDIVPAATLANYTMPAVADADDGAVFRVIVTNPAGSTTSQSAILTVGHGWRRIGGAVDTGPVLGPSLAIDAAGTRYVSYTNAGSLVSELFVKRFNGTAWESVGGGAVNAGSDVSTLDHTTIIGADGWPIVAWNEGSRVRVARWTGTQWDVIGDNLEVDQSGSLAGQFIQLARAGSDLIAAWTEIPPPFNERRIAVTRYDAAMSDWSPAAYIPNVLDARQIRMSLDAAGLPSIAYVPRPLSGGAGAIQVVRQGASGWEPLGGDVGPEPVANSSGLIANYGIGIKFDGTGSPVVFGSADGIRLFSFRHDGTAWQPLTGTDGVFVSLDPVNESTALMEFTRGGPQIAMAYTRQQLSNGGLRFITEYRSWNGSLWMPIGEPLRFHTFALSPELTAAGNPIFAGHYQPSGGVPEIVVQEFVP
ncbi:MAG TPA: PKD domain-containing protein [Steroidobacteraceae bacterium]|nr:PKD domain-containing protein [Steroidobacteraceae bacterium]